MSSEVSVRRAEAADFDAWYELFEAVAGEGRWIGAELPLDRDWFVRSFERSLDLDGFARFLAEIGGALVGELGVTAHLGVADLGMMVADGHRGRGVGSALMEACVGWCRDSAMHKVTLHVFPHNAAARALYQRFGFEEEGRLVRHYRRATGQLWDAIPMALVLDEAAPGSPFADAAG